MILEVAILDVKSGQEDHFVEAFRQAQTIIASMPGYLSHELQKSDQSIEKLVTL